MNASPASEASDQAPYRRPVSLPMPAGVSSCRSWRCNDQRYCDSFDRSRLRSALFFADQGRCGILAAYYLRFAGDVFKRIGARVVELCRPQIRFLLAVAAMPVGIQSLAAPAPLQSHTPLLPALRSLAFQSAR